MDIDEEGRPTSPVDSLIDNEVPSPRNDSFPHKNGMAKSQSFADKNGMARSVSRIGAEMIYHNLRYALPVKVKRRKTEKEILKNASGIMGPGINAILGPTGSGKTTLLDILAGRKEKKYLSGNVLVNGSPQTDNFRLQSGFVVQDDVVMGTLTVRENLAFSASLRLPNEYSSADRKARVEMILHDLGLQDCANTKVGTDERRGISGGERKRTSIGMELIIAPDVLFLDEPTTGLDAFTACQVIQRLQRQAEKGRTIIFSIHQPRYSIFKLFDTITLLSAGETVYHGPNEKSLEYFQNLGHYCEKYNNPGDFFMDIISRDLRERREHEYVQIEGESIYDNSTPPLTLAEHYLNSEQNKNTLLKIEPIVESLSEDDTQIANAKKPTYQSSAFKQIRIVSKRAVKNLVRDPRAFTSQLIVNLIYALIVGGLYYQLEKGSSGIQNRNGVFFFLVTNSIFSNMSAVAVFMRERPVFRHESANGYYRVSSYFFAKVFCDLLPMRLFPLLIFCAITYFMIGLKYSVDSFFLYVLLLFLTSLSAVALCVFVSSSVNLLAVANLAVSVPFVFMMLFSGFLIRLADIPVVLRWIHYVSIFRYGFSGLQLNELNDMTFGSTCGKFLNSTCQTGNEYLTSQGVSYPHDLWIDVIALACIALGFLILTYIQLRRMKKFN